jgi:hypothetical protein
MRMTTKKMTMRLTMINMDIWKKDIHAIDVLVTQLLAAESALLHEQLHWRLIFVLVA